MEAVTNATTLILLAKINRLDLLRIIKVIRTTPKIRQEVLEGKGITEREKLGLEKIFSGGIVEKPTIILPLDIGSGERSALSLCKEKNINLFLSDDKKARKAANILQIQSLGTIGIILKNLQEKKITKQEAKQILNLLITHSYYITTDLYIKTIELIEKC